MHDVFIAHDRADLEWARRLKAALAPQVSVYLAKDDAGPGPWDEQIAEAQNHALLSAVIVSPAVGAGYYDSEEIARGIALMREDPHRHRVVPVLVGGIEPSVRSLKYGLMRLNKVEVAGPGQEDEAARVLARWANDMRGELDAGRRDVEELFRPPVFDDTVRRESIGAAIGGARSAHRVVVVEALSGSGKTYAMAQYARESSTPFLWYDVAGTLSLGEMLADLSGHLGFRTTADRTRCRELLLALRERSACLVVDGFPVTGDWPVLVQEALASHAADGTCRLVLLARERSDLRGRPGVGVVEFGGFSTAETVRFLEHRGITTSSVAPEDAARLARVTNGLPLALSVFATMVHDYGVSPQELLTGALSTQDRVMMWIGQVLARLGPDATRLASFLAVLDRPFTAGLVGRVGRRLRLPAVDVAFAELQRHYLVERISPTRWRIHALVARSLVERMRKDVVRQHHLLAARDYLRARNDPSRRISRRSDFLDAVSGVRHLQQAGRWRAAEQHLEPVAWYAKTTGAHTLLLALCQHQVQSGPGNSPWMHYHLAHCYLVLGRLRAADHALTRVLPTVDDPLPRLALTRLRAEIEGERGYPSDGIALLEHELRSMSAHVGSARQLRMALQQTQSSLASLYLQAGDSDRAASLLGEVERAVRRHGDKRGLGVVVCRQGSVHAHCGDLAQAEEAFASAADLFAEAGDVRGLGWAMIHRAAALLALDRRTEAVAPLRVALELQEHREECSLDYLVTLRQIEASDPPPPLAQPVSDAIARVTATRD